MHTKNKIVVAMVELFSKKGYLASMSDISKIVGIKVPSIYSHFENKDAIICKAIEYEMDSNYEFLEELYSQYKDESSEKKLKEIYFNVLDYYSDYKKLGFIRNIDLIPKKKVLKKAKELKVARMKKIISTLEYVFSQADESGEIKYEVAEDYHLLYITMIEGILTGLLTFDQQPEVRRAYEEKIWRMFWNAVKA